MKNVIGYVRLWYGVSSTWVKNVIGYVRLVHLIYTELNSIVEIIATVSLSHTCTERIPSEFTSNVTSICGTFRGMGGIPFNVNCPRRLLSLVNCRSPS